MKPDPASNLHVILTGTDPASGLGGISFALRGYKAAFESIGLPHTLIITHTSRGLIGKIWPWLVAIPTLLATVIGLRARGWRPVVYSHPGAGISMFRQLVLIWLGRLAGARVMLQVHSPEIVGYLDHPLQRVLIKLFLESADILCVPTAWWQRFLGEAGIRAELRIVPNPMPMTVEEYARNHVAIQRACGADSPVVILCMARMVAGKGVDVAILALRHLPERFQLVVAGDGPLLEDHRRLARREGVERRVRFTGWLDRAGKERHLREADLFCLPTRNDSFGMGFVEAMAFSLPVVALHWNAIPEVVPDGVAGILVREYTPQAVAAALLAVSDEPVRRAMGEAGRQWVLERFAYQRIGGILAGVVAELAGES